MVKKLLLVTGFIGIGAASQVYATDLVCVNGDELMEQSNYAKEIKEKLQQRAQELQKQIEAKVKEIQNRLSQLQKELQSGLLTKEAKEAKQKEFIKLQQELQMYQLQYQQQIRMYFQEEFKKLDALVKAALKALAQTEHYKAVANCKDLLYYDPSIDITQSVVKLVDQMAKQSKEKKQK